jgi:mannose-1-phosphate guanylyltransferase/mannose-6-phosphate isomerase
MLVPVILSGGSGTRLWPVSRASYPKQFVNLVDPDRSLLQVAAERTKGLNIEHTGWLVVANNGHRFLIADQLRQINANVERVILEPVARNTAPAVALAALYALRLHDKPRLLIQTADHVIPDVEYFCSAVEMAYHSSEPMVTFGVQPTRPETGRGYIQASDLISDPGLSKVERFVEKPELATAEQYLEEGGYLWNSGMFLLDAEVYLDELSKYNPVMLAACKQAVERSEIDLDFCRVDIHPERNETPVNESRSRGPGFDRGAAGAILRRGRYRQV